MSYAVRKDGNGFRAVAHQNDIDTAHEDFSFALPDYQIPAEPDVRGFIEAIKLSLGGIVAVNQLMRDYPAFEPALTMHLWDDVADLVVDAKNTSVLSARQYADFQAAFSANSIPITLP